jgi:hypothetical protein
MILPQLHWVQVLRLLFDALKGDREEDRRWNKYLPGLGDYLFYL